MSSIFSESDELGLDPSLDDFFANSSFQNFSSKKTETKTFFPEKKIIKNFSQNPIVALVESMKTSFLPREFDADVIRQVLIRSDEKYPFFLLRYREASVLIGSAFSEVEQAGKKYTIFGDMRLPFSEKNRIQAWIVTDEFLDIDIFLLALEALDFPMVYAPQSLISRISDEISRRADLSRFLSKIRFSKIFQESLKTEITGIPFIFWNASSGFEIGFYSGENIFFYQGKNSENLIKCDQEGFSLDNNHFLTGEIVTFTGGNISKKSMKFTFDTFYLDEKSVGTLAGYPFNDRKTLSESGVLVFTIEENITLRTLGHIFIDSRGFVHPHEMMRVHKELIKNIREIYENALQQNPELSRLELVHIWRREVAKSCFALVGRIPVVMPIILERK